MKMSKNGADYLTVTYKMEWDFLTPLRNENKRAKYYAGTQRNYGQVQKNRLWMNYPADFYRKCFLDIFDGAESKDCYLFGSGKYAESFLDVYGSYYPIKGVFDNDAEKWGKLLRGIAIMTPKLLEEWDTSRIKVFICVRDYDDILRQLEEYRLPDCSVYDRNKKYRGRHLYADRVSETEKKYKIGYVAGAFDMFHIGHLNLLRRAKERSDYLIAGVMSDEKMFDLKRKYPVIPYHERMQVVAGCRYVDRVEELPIDRAGIMDAYNMFHFDCMFSGDDHANDPGWLAEQERLRAVGSDIVFVSYTKEQSSTAIREKMKE